LRDLHVSLSLAGTDIPVFDRPRAANSNPPAHKKILGGLHVAGRLQWAVTSDKIGFVAIYGWDDGSVPEQFDKALEQMRDTKGLIVDVRWNGGGNEVFAQQVAGRFLPKEVVYAYDQFRDGLERTNLTKRFPRKVEPSGPWRYQKPVILLIGQKCMSSSESFVGMMMGATNVTTMGDHTCGSSGNPQVVELPLQMTVGVPRWIDYLPDGTPLDEHGFKPQISFIPSPDGMSGSRDELLSAALERLRHTP
jgi:C-terminal processing protease CtpA/Prc